MTVSNIVNSAVFLSVARSTFAGFGRPVILHTFTADQRTAIGANDFVVTGASWQPLLKSFGVTSSETIWVALSRMFGQALQIDQVYIISASDKVQQQGSATVGEAVDGTYKITIGADVFTHVASSDTDIAIAIALAALIDADPKYTSPVPVISTLTYDIDQAGISETVVGESPNNLLTTAITQAGNGYVEDLIQFNTDVTTDYWAILETARNAAENLKLVRYGDSQSEKMALVLTTETNALITGDADHLGAFAAALELESAAIFFDPTITNFPEFGLVGLQLPKTPGSTNWHMQKIAGEAGFVPSNRGALEDSRYNWNEKFESVTGSPSASQQGITPSGQFIDEIRGRDAFKRDLREAMFFLLLEADKIDFSDLGTDQFVAVLKAVVDRWDANGFLDADTLVVSTVAVADIPSATRDLRCLFGIEYNVQTRGAVNKIEDPSGGPGITGFLYA